MIHGSDAFKSFHDQPAIAEFPVESMLHCMLAALVLTLVYFFVRNIRDLALQVVISTEQQCENFFCLIRACSHSVPYVKLPPPNLRPHARVR